MSSLDYILVAMNSYVDGVGKLGSTERASTPKIKKVMEKFRGGGMLGTRMIPMGYESFEWEVDYSSYDPQVIQQVGLFSGMAIRLSNTASMIGDNGAKHSANLICRGQFTDLDPGSWEGGKKAMIKVRAALDALKLTIDNVTIYDIDVAAEKYIVNGVDEYAAIRAAL
ncbi:phage major tail tube protein [Rhodoblastus sp.]|uniref:phage major tail tube protein n=1 Tax=Rhodoblastus sp. TaxID=1962975 RepID=UPI003F9DC1D4